MVRGCVIFGVAAAMFVVAPAWAGASATAAPTPITAHYSSQIPPGAEDALIGAVPVAAPTAPVTAAPLLRSENAPAPPPVAAPPPIDETVRVTALRPSEDSDYRLGTGDKLRVTVFGEDDLSGTFEIDSQGWVRLPLIGQIQAKGLTTYGLEERIDASLVKGGYMLNPRVNVEITGYRPFYIIGEVTKPGEYAYVNAMRAPNAIALAGGYTDRAVESSIYIRHPGDPEAQEYPADETTRILPGDVVRVERSTYWTVMTLLQPLISPFASIAYLLK